MQSNEPKDWTPEELEQAAQKLAQDCTLAKLRQFQNLNQRQTVKAFEKRASDSLDNLQAMFKVYMRAVELRAFPDCRPKGFKLGKPQRTIRKWTTYEVEKLRD